MTARRILLADADAFFVAVARMVDPEGAGRASLLIVGGSASGRGVVCSASYEARKFGVRSAMPTAQAIRLCPRAMVVPVPAECGAKSRAIATVLRRLAPVVAPSSIDEWYLDMAGTEELYGGESLYDTAHRIRRAVIDETGLSVSFGGGSSRLVAKVAVELAKPKPGTGASGVHVVAPGAEAAFMTRFKLADLPMVGPKFQQRLAEHDLRTVPDAVAAGLPALARWFGEREAEWLWARIHGVDDSPVAERDEQKSVGREDTFAQDLHVDADLERELVKLAVRVSADLRGDGLRARTVTVKIRDADFTTRQAGRTLPEAVESERAVTAVALDLLRELRRRRRVGVRLLGVTLSGFGEPRPKQLALFDVGTVAGDPAPTAPVETERDRTLSRAMDDIRAKFGARAIVPAKALDDNDR